MLLLCKRTIREFHVFLVSKLYRKRLTSEPHGLPLIPPEIIRKPVKSFATIVNGFQPLTIVAKLSIGFLMISKGIEVARKSLRSACFCKD